MHTIPISDELEVGILQIRKKYDEAISNGDLPHYPVFVDKLFKELDTPEASAIHAAIGCAGEGGELLDCVKKVWIYGKKWDQFDPKTNDTPVENLLEELGDFRFYYQKLLNMLGVNDAQIQALNVAKLRKRYPKGEYSNEAAQTRADKEIKVERKFFGQPSVNADAQHQKGSAEWAANVTASMAADRQKVMDQEQDFLYARQKAIQYVSETFDNLSLEERAKWLAKERTISFDLLAEKRDDGNSPE